MKTAPGYSNFGMFLMLLAPLVLFEPGEADAQPYPSNTIRIVTPAGPGALPDVISRIVASELAESEGWRVVIENRPGALTTIAIADVLKQPADGYSIFPLSAGVMATPTLLPNLGLRLDADFVPVIKIATSHNVLVVTPSLPAKSATELVGLLRNDPDKFNLAVGGFGTPSHFLGEAFKLQTGVRVAIIPYQQPQQRITGVLNGTAHASFFGIAAVVNLVSAGKLRALAVTAPSRIAAMKEIPTIGELGFPDLVTPGEDWVGFLVKSGTPNDVVARLNQAVNRALAKQRVRAALASLGAEPVGGSAAEFGDQIKSQLVYYENFVKEAGIKLPQ